MCYFLASWEKGAFLFYPAEAVVQRCSVKKVFLEILQNSQENTCARVSFLIKLQASGFFWIPFFLIVEVSFLHSLYEFHEIKLNVMKYTLNCVSWNSLKEIFHSVSSSLAKLSDFYCWTSMIHSETHSKSWRDSIHFIIIHSLKYANERCFPRKRLQLAFQQSR